MRTASGESRRPSVLMRVELALLHGGATVIGSAVSTSNHHRSLSVHDAFFLRRYSKLVRSPWREATWRRLSRDLKWRSPRHARRKVKLLRSRALRFCNEGCLTRTTRAHQSPHKMRWIGLLGLSAVHVGASSTPLRIEVATGWPAPPPLLEYLYAFPRFC